MKSVFFLYLLFINLTGFLVFYSDKRRAQRHRFRISERALFLTAVLGGGAGCLISMYVFRHKTRHFRFVAGIPLLTAAWVCLCLRLLPML